MNVNLMPVKPYDTSEPSSHAYGSMTAAYDFFNVALFGGALPPCLITLQRKAKSYGYFSPNRFEARDGDTATDEIAMNPQHFRERSVTEILGTLVHEQVHLWQQHLGEPPKTAYHNKQWAAKMKEVGLYPSTTAAPGGKETGTHCSHYIIEGGPFAVACERLIKSGFTLPYVERFGDLLRKKKAASKTKFVCDCGLNVWAKPSARVMCAECETLMEAEEA